MQVRSLLRGDVVIRYAGRRLRIGRDWTDIHPDALAFLKSRRGEQIEVRDVTAAAPVAPTPEPVAPPEPEPPEDDSEETRSPRKRGKGSKSTSSSDY
jgi:hypothetical protein